MARASEALISIHYVAIFLQLMHEYGIDSSPILAGTQLSVSDCKNPDGLISFYQYERIIANALEKSKKPELGLIFGKQLNLMAHGDLGIVMMSSETIQQALEMGVHYLATRNPLIHLAYELEKNLVKINIHLDFAKGAVKRFLLDMTMASIHYMRLFLIGADAGPCKLYFSYSQPEDSKIYETFFHQLPCFSNPESAYAFASRELKIPLPLADALTREIAEKRCKKKLENISRRFDWSSRVQQIMLSRPGHFPSLEEVAAKLFVSSRTLRRHLETESTSFQNILNNLKQEMAEDYLKSTSLSIAEISDLLNYSDPSNFANAFKKKLGITPQQFRESQ